MTEIKIAGKSLHELKKIFLAAANTQAPFTYKHLEVYLALVEAVEAAVELYEADSNLSICNREFLSCTDCPDYKSCEILRSYIEAEARFLFPPQAPKEKKKLC